MHVTKDELEKQINNADVFDIDPKRDAVLYRTARTALFSLVASYYRDYIYPNRPQEEYSLTLIETAAECIKYYNREKGDFLHLLNHNMRRNMRIERAKQMQEERRQGIRLAQADMLTIQKIIALVNSKNLDINDYDVQVKIAKFLNISLERVIELIAMNENAVAMGEYTTTEEGESISIFETIKSREGDPGKNLESYDAIESIFQTLNEMFLSAQIRTQKLISMLLTSRILEEFEGDFEVIHSILEKYSFYNAEIMNYYKNHQKVLTARQISKLCGVSEQSASRTLRNFLAKREKYD